MLNYFQKAFKYIIFPEPLFKTIATFAAHIFSADFDLELDLVQNLSFALMRAASYSPTVPRKSSRSKSLRTCEPGFARTDCDLELHLGLWGESLDDRLSAKEGS